MGTYEWKEGRMGGFILSVQSADHYFFKASLFRVTFTFCRCRMSSN